jgi:NodT family efflux transporter outer membrane factor (OMF) lipoprotein
MGIPWRNRIVLALLGIAVSGCIRVGPEYVTPELEWAASWEAERYAEIGNPLEQAGFDLRFWWLLFDDPVLNQLIELARLENPGLQIAGLRIIESRAALGIATGLQYPQVQQVTGAIDLTGSKQSGESAQTDVTPKAGFNVGWELDFWGKYARQIEAADASFYGSIANQQDIQVLLSAQIADLYFAYRTTLRRIEIALENADIQERSFEITTRLFESGQESELDLQQAKTQYLATLSSIPGLEITERQIRNALSILLGRPPGALPELDSETRRLPIIEPVALQDFSAQILMRRPDIRVAATDVAFWTAQVGIAEAGRYPSISLFGNVGFSGSTLSLGIGPSISWNIFNYGRIKNNIRVQDARLQQSIINFQNVALGVAKEIDDAAISIVKTREQAVPQRESTISAERTLELANTRYREGYGDFQRVIDAQRAVARQNEQELLNHGNHLSAIINFYKAVGGGWVDMPLEDLISDSTRTQMERRSNWGDLLRQPIPVLSDSLILSGGQNKVDE